METVMRCRTPGSTRKGTKTFYVVFFLFFFISSIWFIKYS